MASSGFEPGVADQRGLYIGPDGQMPLPEGSRRNSLAHAIVAIVHEPVIVLDRGLHIVAASESYHRMFPADFASEANRANFETSSLPWDGSVTELLTNVLSQDAAVDDYEIELDVPNGGRRRMLLSARRAAAQSKCDTAVVIGLADLTALREARDLRTALQENKDMLLLEAHHRIANSLQIVASILLLRARSVQSEETRRHLQDAHRRLVAVATVQHQLSVSEPGKRVEFDSYLKLLCAGLTDSMFADDERLSVTAFATPGTVEPEVAVSLGLIVTELVINALKHGFPGGRMGRIVVEYVNGGSDWRLTVSDDGVGRQSDPQERPHVGLGTSIVEALARNLNARVEIQSPAQGAQTTVTHST
jgi:two-component sensor histidine kinase